MLAVLGPENIKLSLHALFPISAEKGLFAFVEAITKPHMPNGRLHIGLIDADLLDGGTRHPNLALLKIAGYLRDNGFVRDGWEKGAERSYELITVTKESGLTTLDWGFLLAEYDRFYLSRVFTFTEMPEIYLQAENYYYDELEKFQIGGTGRYANEQGSKFFFERSRDMHQLEKDRFLIGLRAGAARDEEELPGINMRTQMPDYHLYDDYINILDPNKTSKKFKDYRYYSIGFLTRGCFRKCSFCVNKFEAKAKPYSRLVDFLDNERDENGKLVRPYIYLWDDNFLASPHWKEMLQELIETRRPFQFRQGLDERLLAQSTRGEEMAEMLSRSKYHGDFIFAFDNWHDRKIIERALKIWKRHCPRKGTKFYLFCGFQQKAIDKHLFLKDICEIFMRIRVLMSYGCIGYIMRHEDYKKAPLSNIYVQIARWCNQQQFYKKMSFGEFCYRNQTYWEKQNEVGDNGPDLISYEDFIHKYESGYYDDVKMCLPLKSLLYVLKMFPEHKNLLMSFFSQKMDALINPELWEINNEEHNNE